MNVVLIRTRSASFIVRLRVEPEGAAGWRGEVQHVESGERAAFRDEAKLLGFLCRHLSRLRHAATGSSSTRS
jgi:hypothetical protein